MRHALFLAAAAVSVSIVASCAPQPVDSLAPAEIAPATLSDALAQASVRYQVPRDVLAALAWAEGRWLEPGETPAQSEANGEGAHSALEVGPLHLRHNPALDTLRRAGELLGVDEASLRTSLGLQVQGAAAVLAELGRATGARADDVDSWAEAVARYSGLEGRTVQVEYARQVWEALRQGRREATFTGEELLLAGRQGPDIETLLHVEQVAQFSADYPPAHWVPAASANYSTVRDSGPIQYVVIHDTEGSYASAISLFQTPRPSNPSSAHYVIRSSDGDITQMIRESDTAWHCANHYFNNTSVGIEHEGFYTDPGRWYTEAMYVASARLTRHLCDTYHIPIDRDHIFGHYQVYADGRHTICTGTWDYCRTVTANHIDPGPGWNWSHYLDLVRSNGGPVAAMYDAQLVTVSYPHDMASGARAVAYVEYRNTGSASWDTTNTRIGTTQPRDHTGRLYDSVNWLNMNRPTAVDRATASGATGRFSFVVHAPTVTTDTTVTESYGLVQEGAAWFGPADNAVTLTIRVHADGSDAGTTPDDAGPVDEDGGATDDAGPTPDAAVATTDSGITYYPDAGIHMPRDASTGPDTTTHAGCSCRAAGDSRSSRSPLLALGLAAGAFASVRRRQRRRQ